MNDKLNKNKILRISSEIKEADIEVFLEKFMGYIT